MQKRCPFHHRGLECKSRKSRNTWSNRQIWPWNTKWSRAKVNRVLPREHPLQTIQENHKCNKYFMIWATVSSWSCFHWLYRASPSLAAKNIINVISVLTIWWCPCHLLCCCKREFAMTSVFSWQNSTSLWPVSFCIPRPNLPVTPGMSWVPTFASIPL